ncbi:MAG: DUF2141 domain-containing protein [Chitinophagaceae bacterium]
MKTLLCFGFLGFHFSAVAQGTLIVQVKPVNEARGELSVALYRKPSDFPHPVRVYVAQTPKAVQGTNLVRFTNLPAGNYAAAVYHDENANKKLDKNLFGAPTEAYGFSNNARRLMSAPSFDEARFEIRDNEVKEIQIQIK